MLMIAYWRRATVAGAMAAMIAGAVTMLALFVTGWLGPDPMIGHATKFRPCYLLGLEPIVWGLAASTLAGVAVSLLTRPPAPERVGWLFDASQCDGAVAKQAEGPDTKPVG
jgi:SSS family solute:Na+ symporter/sodium/pantothenate symporter